MRDVPCPPRSNGSVRISSPTASGSGTRTTSTTSPRTSTGFPSRWISTNALVAEATAPPRGHMTTTATPAHRSSDELTPRQITTILIGLMSGMFLAALDQNVVGTAMKTIADELHGLDQQVWVTTAYMITSTISTPIYGKLSDLYGRKKFFLTAITIFIIGSAMCSFATSSVFGPIIGGFFSEAPTVVGITGWRWVFLINIPVGIFALIAVTATLHLHHTKRQAVIDWLGAATLVIGVVPLLLVAEQGRTWGWTSTNSILP